MPEPSKISLEWEYYVFVMIPFPGVSWDVCGADPLLGSQSGWKLVKLPLPHLKLSTLKGSAAVFWWKFQKRTFSISSAFCRFFLRHSLSWGLGPGSASTASCNSASLNFNKLTKLSRVLGLPIFNQIAESLTRPTHWQLWKEFWHPKLPKTWNLPIIGYSIAMVTGNFRVEQAKHGNVLTLHFSLLAQCNILLTNSAPLLQTSVSRLSCRSMAFTSLGGLSCNCILKKIQAHSSLCWLWYINPASNARVVPAETTTERSNENGSFHQIWEHLQHQKGLHGSAGCSDNPYGNAWLVLL